MASLKRVKRCVSPLLRPSICLAMQRCLLVPVSFAVFVVAGAGSSSPANARTRRAAGGFLHPRPQREDEEEEVEELQGCDCRTRQQGQRVRSLASAAGRLPKACPEGCTRPDAQHLRAGALLLPNSTDTDTVGTEGTEQLKRALRAWLLEASANPWLDPLKEATSRGGRRLAGGCPANSLLEAMSEADTCEITAVERAERGSNAGKESGLLEFLTIGECSYVAFLIYGAILGSLSGMGPGTLAIIGIVLVCWPIAACKVCCRCCRKCCCSCCREGKEVRKIGNVKKIVILLLSLAGLGGMAALPMAGIMGDVKAGSAVANSADCASREFLRSALGDVTAIGNAASVPAGGSSAAADPDPGSNSSRLLQGASFIGIATAGQEVQTVSTAVDALATAATQAAAQDNGAADHVAESLAILRLMQDSLSGQISIGGSTCTFCQTCCGTQAGALVPQLLSQLEGTPSRVTTLSADFQEEPGSRISSLKAAVVSAGAALSLLQQSFQAGPAAALILGSDLFVDPVQEMVVMGFEFGAVPIAGIGLVFLFYSLHWCCCLRRCKIDRKDHPAPQWAACGWCGGCLGALLAALLGIVTFASAAVGSEFCIMMDTLSASDGLDRYSILLGLSGDSTQVVAARSASLACLGPAADVPSRDLFPMLGLSAPVQGLSDMAADLSSLLSFDFTPLLTQYQTLNAQAQSSATTFTPTPADATSQVYTCYTWISLAQAPTSTSCDLPTFQANMQTLAQLALQSGQDASAALGSIRQSSSVWQSTLSDMQALTAHPSLAALQSGLDCAEVFDAWQVANDQACAGLADTFSTSGFVWLLAGACGFVGAIGQYWIWRNLKDNRTLFFDEHEDMKPRGMKKLFCCFCATSVGDDLDAGKTQAEEAPKEPSEKATSRSKSTGGAKTSVASKRIAIRFFEAFEMSVEENVKAFLRDELYPSYDESFKNMAVADRMASWKALEKQKQSGGDVEVQPPGEQPTDPATLFSDYGERGPDGVPTADSEGKPLDKKKLAALKKDLALLQKPWDKWQNDKRKYEAYLLSKIRKQCLEKYAEVQYTEEVEHLRPLSPTSRTENDRWPLKEAAFSGQAEVLEAVTSALRASLTMAAPWKCQCGQQCKAAAEYCSKCGLHWRQAGYPTYAAPPAQHDGGGWWRTRSPRSRGEGGKGKAKRPLSPRQRGRGKSGQQEPKGGAAPSGKGKGAEVSTSTSTAYMKQVPTVPVLSQPAQPPAVPSMDGQEKLPQTVQDILNSLSSSKEALPAEVRTVLEAHMETSHHHATKQLHKLVAQQSRAQKELLAIQKSRGIFVQEWSSYLDQLTQLLQKQVQQKEESLAALAASEAGWQEQLATATRAIRQQTSATSSAQSIVDSSEEEQQAMEAEVEVDAAADASRQAAIEQSKLREANLIMALQSATAASAAQAQQYRERTPRRRKSEDKEPEAKKEEMAPAAKGDVTPPGKAQ
eukprot:s1746_g3.t1